MHTALDEPTGDDQVLDVTLECSTTTCRIALRGTLCATTVAALESQIDQLGHSPCHTVIVDMQGLTDLDSVGAKVILGLHHYVEGRGGELRVNRPPRHIATTLVSVTESVIQIDDPPS